MENKKNYIQETAMELFSEKGYASTSMRDIAKRGGIALGLAYNYFASKEELLLAIVESGLKDIRAISHEIQKKEDIIKMMDDFFTLLQRNSIYWKLFIQLMMQGHFNDTTYARATQTFHKFFSTMEKGFQKFSKFPEELSGTILHGIIFEYVLTGDTGALDKSKKIIFKGL